MATPIRRIIRSTSECPWINPCHRTNIIRSPSLPFGLPPPPVTTQPPDLKVLMKKLKYRVVDSVSSSENLKQAVFTHRLNNNLALAEFLEKEPVYDGFPDTFDIVEWTGPENTSQVIVKDYENLSRLLVFLEQVKWDDKDKYNGNIKTNIEETIKRHLDCLCTMTEVLSCLGYNQENFINRNIMPQYLRDITIRAERNKRDFRISKDNLKYMNELKHNYQDIYDQI